MLCRLLTSISNCDIGQLILFLVKFDYFYTTPDGLVVFLHGPFEGRRHDSGMLRESGLLQVLEEHSFSPNGDIMCIYGDPANPLRPHLQAPCRNAALTEEQQTWNQRMSSTRVSVEWLFGDIINYFKFLDFNKNLNIQLSSVGEMYIVCTLLKNARNCVYGSSTSNFFQVDPPNIEDYFKQL